ncbi:unnamed protein product, partial [Amoebophrya sp. A25]
SPPGSAVVAAVPGAAAAPPGAAGGATSTSVAANTKSAAELEAAMRNCKHYANINAFLQQYISTSGSGIEFSFPQDTSGDREFLETEQLTSLRVVISSWDRLHDLLERNTLSPGVKACREVRPMVLQGVFIFHGTSDTNLQLVCRMPGNPDVRFEQLAETRRLLLMTEPPPEEAESTGIKTGALEDGGVGDGDPGQMTGTEDVDMVDASPPDSSSRGAGVVRAFATAGVVDLHMSPGATTSRIAGGATSSSSRRGQQLMLDENSLLSPEERHHWRRNAERAVNRMKLKDLVDDFVRKLEVLEDIRHLVADLHNHGHFDFAHGEVLHISPLESIAAMRSKKEELYNVFSDWRTNLQEIRGQYYCLNYFVVKHLQALRDDIRSVEAAYWERGCLPLRDNYTQSDMKTDFFHLLQQRDIASSGAGGSA